MTETILGQRPVIKLKQLVLCVLLTFSAHVYSQSYQFFHIDKEDGLPSSTTYKIKEDSKGRLWFCTDNGLALYDGRNFKVWSTDNGLKSNYILDITETGRDSFWISCYRNCLQLFVNNHPTEVTLPNNAAIELYHYKQCLIQKNSGSYISICRLNNEKETILNELGKGGLIWNNQFVWYRNDSLFFRNIESIFPKNKTPKVDQVKLIRNMGCPNGKIISIAKYDESNLLILTQNCIFKFSTTNLVTKLMSVPRFENVLTTAFVDKDNNIWISNLNSGLSLIRKNTIVDCQKMFKSDGTINAGDFLEDHFGNLWISTSDKGVYCLSNRFIEQYTSVDGLDNGNVLSAFQNEDSRLVVGCRNYLFFEKESGFSKIFTENHWDYLSIAKVHDKYLVGCRGAVNHNKEKPGLYTNTALQKDNVMLYQGITKPILYKNKVEIISKTFGSLIYNERYSNKFKHVDTFSWKKEFMDSLFIQKNKSIRRSIHEAIEYNGDYYLATNIGLFVYRPETRKYLYYADSNASRIQQILTYKDSVYVFTNHSLTVLLDNHIVRQSNSFLGEQLKNFKTAICTIDGDFFFVTNETLYLYYRNKKFALNHLNGLLTSEINALSYQPVYKTLCVATVKGLNKINLEKLFFSRFYPPQPQIESVRGGEKIYLQPKGELYFEQNENYISIAIEPWNYTEIKSLHFLYTIDDNQHWEVTTNTKIDFSALSYGKHIIKIKAKTANSDYSKLLEQPVYIEYPFYLQWWFFFSVIIVVIVIVSSFFYSRIQLIRQGNREKQNMFSQIIELKQKGLAASMNPHFIFNSLNSIQYFVNSNNMLEANEYMAKFAKLIRLYLSSSLEGHLTLQEEIHRLELYLSLEKMRFGERLTFAIKHNNIDDLSSIKLPTMLIQPFVENAILHGILPSKTNGYIEIEFLQAEHELIIQIKDNGIGIDKTKTIKQSNHTSYAMEVILERIRIDNKTNNLTTSIVFYAAKEKGFSETGTVVEIRLSLK